MKYLVVGLGNPGKTYIGTRHNVGFHALDELARKYGLLFKKSEAWKGDIAEGSIRGVSTILLKPLTYMNLSGESVAYVMRYFGIGVSHLLVIVDDVAIPLGQLRIRINSGSGGHNGLKSVEDHLQTNGYTRLRIGVSDRKEGDLSSYVLGHFTEDEKKLLPGVLGRVIEAVEIWLEKGLTSAMDFSNKDPSNPSIGEEQ